MISSTQLARAIAVYSYKTGTKSVNGPEGIASSVGLASLMVINAINKGEKEGFFSVKRKKGGIDSISVSSDQYDGVALVPSSFGEEIFDFCEAILESVTNANSRENDLSRDQILYWSGASPFMFTVTMEILLASGALAQYSIADKNDSKTIYEFLTLPENVDKRWGSKQLGK